MKRPYKIVKSKNFGRTCTFFQGEDFDDWANFTKEEMDIATGNKRIGDYLPYIDDVNNNIDYLETCFNVLNTGKHLSVLTRQDFINLIAEIFEAARWKVFFPRNRYNKYINMLLIKKFKLMGYARCVFLIKKKSVKSKIGIKDVRELKSIVEETGAYKGAIITTTSLTLGALKLVEENSDLLFYLDSKKIEDGLRNLRKVSNKKAS